VDTGIIITAVMSRGIVYGKFMAEITQAIKRTMPITNARIKLRRIFI
jgi:hypothetical protein